MGSCCLNPATNPNALEFGKGYKAENNAGCCGSCGCNASDEIPQRPIDVFTDEMLTATLILYDKNLKLVQSKNTRKDFSG